MQGHVWLQLSDSVAKAFAVTAGLTQQGALSGGHPGGSRSRLEGIGICVTV